MSWLDKIPRRISWTWLIDWPCADAGMDKCKACGEQRRTHGRRTHQFKEEEPCPKK